MSLIPDDESKVEVNHQISEKAKPDVLSFFEGMLEKANPNDKLSIFHGMEIFNKMSQLSEGGVDADPKAIAEVIRNLINSEAIPGDQTEDQGMQLIPLSRAHKGYVGDPDTILAPDRSAE